MTRWCKEILDIVRCVSLQKVIMCVLDGGAYRSHEKGCMEINQVEKKFVERDQKLEAIKYVNQSLWYDDSSLPF